MLKFVTFSNHVAKPVGLMLFLRSCGCNVRVHDRQAVAAYDFRIGESNS